MLRPHLCFSFSVPAVWILALRPELPVILCTGYAGQFDRSVIPQSANCRLVSKPYTRETLLNAVQAALRRETPIA